MNFFNILRQHVAAEPWAIASRSSRRAVTYRKFWSRIERASARLKGEWNVQHGDTVVYWGCGNQDALMLFVAVARCGAKLLPLEHDTLRSNVAAILQQHPAAVLLHDDELFVEDLANVRIISTLSSLIATRCHYHPEITEDDTLPSLLTFVQADKGALQSQETTLQQLVAQSVDAHAISPFTLQTALFDADILAPHVLPVLTARGKIIFR
jgi:acyl-coenzyme A synthetase/AMP-(fatty) acid ligase